jgi:hypothetical protein
MENTEHNHEDGHVHSSGARFNILPLIIIIGILFVLFRYDLRSLVNNPQLEKNISYVKTTVINWWHKVGVPEGSGVFSQFFKTDHLNPLGSTPGINDFINSFSGVKSVDDAQKLVTDKVTDTVKDEVKKQVNTWANAKEVNTTNELVPTHQ